MSQEKIYKNIRVLLLEDNPDDAGLIERVLMKSDFNPKLYHTDHEAGFVRLLKEADPHIVLSDYSLPGFSGFEALRIVRNFDQQLPFVFVTGTVGEEIAAETILNGASGFVLKSNLDKLPRVIKDTFKNKIIWISQGLKKASRGIDKNLEKNIATLDRIKKFLNKEQEQEVDQIKRNLNDLLISLDNEKPPNQ